MYLLDKQKKRYISLFSDFFPSTILLPTVFPKISISCIKMEISMEHSFFTLSNSFPCLQSFLVYFSLTCSDLKSTFFPPSLSFFISGNPFNFVLFNYYPLGIYTHIYVCIPTTNLYFGVG